MILASENNILFSLGLFTWCVFGLRDELAGWAILLCMVCGTYFLFYFIMLDIFIGIQLLVVLNALLRSPLIKKPIYIAVAVILWILVVLSHPTMILCGLFILMFYVLYKPPYYNIWLWIVLLAIGLLVMVIKSKTADAYEREKFNWEFDFARNQYYKQLFQKAFWIDLCRLYFMPYAEITLMLIVSAGYFIRQKKYVLAILSVGFYSGFILLTNITSLGCNMRSDYTEHTVEGIVAVCAILFLYGAYTRFNARGQLIIKGVLICLIVGRAVETLSAYKMHRNRLDLFAHWVDSCQQKPGDKFYINKDLATREDEKIEWTLPIETLFISELKYHTGKTIMTQFALERDRQLGILNNKQLHYGVDKVMAADQLNPHYFVIHDGDYQLLQP
jgi:hypothetical protein